MHTAAPNIYKSLYNSLERKDVELEIDRRYLGYTRLTQGWSTQKWIRGGTWHVIYLMEYGELQLVHPDGATSVTPRQSVFIGAGATPQVRSSVPVEFYEIWFNLRNQELADSHELCEEIVTGGVTPEATGLLERIAADLLSGSELGPPPLVFPRFQLLLALLAEDARASMSRQAHRTFTANQRIRLLRWVREHLADPPKPAQLAEILGLTPDYFTRLFRSSFGQSPREWLIAERVSAARRLLDETGASLAQAMEATGFRNHAHFSRTLKRLTGRTPRGHPGWKHSTVLRQ